MCEVADSPDIKDFFFCFVVVQQIIIVKMNGKEQW